MPKVLNVHDDVVSQRPKWLSQSRIDRRKRYLEEYKNFGTVNGKPIPNCKTCGSERTLNPTGNFYCSPCAVKSTLAYKSRNEERVRDYDRNWKQDNYLYGVWYKANSRCHNPDYQNYSRYGGRGISVFPDWRIDRGKSKSENLLKYQNFCDYILNSIGHRPSDIHSLDRYPDNNGNYEPGNLRWATPGEQSNNIRSNIQTKLAISDEVRIKGPSGEVTLLDLSESISMNLKVVKYRYADALRFSHNNVFDYITEDSLEPRRTILYRERKYRLAELLLITGLEKKTLMDRLSSDTWSVEQAVETPKKNVGKKPVTEETSRPRVINLHHFGGVEKLPKGAVYCGRPSPRGNPYSSESGKLTKEECVALHRVHIYNEAKRDPTYLPTLRQELEGKDLACWCKSDRKLVACHCDNYLHILAPDLSQRTYTKSVLSYLMEDLKAAMTVLKAYSRSGVEQDHWLPVYLAVWETALEINYLGILFKVWGTYPQDICEIIAKIVIELELLIKESDETMIKYRWDHVLWTIHRYMYKNDDRTHEPAVPSLPTKPRKKAKPND